MLITNRPEYRGVLTKVSGAQIISLRPLSGAHTAALTAQLLGTDASVGGVAAQVASRAAGNPFFVEEMVRDLAERGILEGEPGAYLLGGDVGDVRVPATLAGDHRRAHRPGGRRRQGHPVRRGGHRAAIRRRSAVQHGRQPAVSPR